MGVRLSGCVDVLIDINLTKLSDNSLPLICLSTLQETTEERVTKEPPYLLFYERNDFDFNSIIKSLSGPDTYQEGTAEGGESRNSNSRRCKVM